MQGSQQPSTYGAHHCATGGAWSAIEELRKCHIVVIHGSDLAQSMCMVLVDVFRGRCGADLRQGLKV